MHPNIHNSIIVNNQKQKQSIDRGMDKENVRYICTCVCAGTHTHTPTNMEYYSAIKKNEVMLFKATWTDLEIIILSEASQKQISYNITYM